MSKEDAKATLELVLINGLLKNADKTGLRAGSKTDMIIKDLTDSILNDESTRWIYSVLFEKESILLDPSLIAQRAMEEVLAHIVSCCRCHDDYVNRGLRGKDPNCQAHDIADEIDEAVISIIQAAIDEDRRERREE